MRAAVYARVSTERQERQQTIDSQLAALRAWAGEQGHAFVPEHVFRDEGHSGARLDRPGLDALRDAAHDGAIDVVAVLSPDRLARKYAHQVLLLEEFRRAGVEVVFLQHPISDDPNDQLLLQIQGAIAEYERAVLGERFRRGKLQKAREGNIIGAKAPYGYAYEPRRGAVPARLVVDEAEAGMVRQLYAWMAEEGLSVRQCIKRLNDGPWVTRSGRSLWSSSVAHHIVSDPVYVGTAYVNRYEYVAPARPRPGTRRAGEKICRRPRPRDQWVAVPVPPLVGQETWDRVQAQMARNAALSFRRNKKHDYLLRCLLKCGRCGLGIHGCVFPGSGRRRPWRYYRCAGTDPLGRARAERCPRARIDADALDRAVWEHVAGLLGDPERLRAQFEHFAAVAAEAAEDGPRSSEGLLRARVEKLDRADRRLLEAYQAGVISLAELAERRAALAAQRELAEAQREHLRRLRERRLHSHEALDSLSAFSGRIAARLQGADIAERQAILKLVVERIIVHDDHIEIEHVIPLREPKPNPGDKEPRATQRLRTDGVRPAEHERHGGAVLFVAQGVGELLVGGVAVALQDAATAAEQRVGVLLSAARRVAVDHRRRVRPAPGPVVARHRPQ
ncbi:MAG: recombinase family protein, partial [Acetobacteraceae bacterium]|nr:recombinase family protein [Acetobacteraceae bacterium]